MERHGFGAMGTHVECFSEAHGAAARAGFMSVEREFERLERLLSRFRADSELSRLNRDGALDAGPELFELVVLALDAREMTGGRFDPTVHDALVVAGYDRSFELLAAGCAESSAPARPAAGEVSVDRSSRRIELAAGARLDLGGIAKGWAVDRACALLAEHGPCLVNAGGDLAVRGTTRDGAWPIGLATPHGERVLGLSSGALATSGSDRRQWRRGGVLCHHLIDPTTGGSATSDVLRLTVIAQTAAQAEVWATALYLAGADVALAEAERRGLPCVAIATDGRTLETGGLA